jgi:thiol-disulfide isomerase/thioredoxin
VQSIRDEFYNSGMEACMVPMTLLVASVLGAGAGLEDGVLDFTAPWCGPCQQLSPMVSRLERQGFPIRKIDCDSNPDLVRKFKVSTIPAFILVIDGVERARMGSGVSEDDLKRLCARVPRKNTADGSAQGTSDADALRGAVLAAPAPKSSSEKSGVKFPFLAVKKDNSVVRDQREGAIPRAKAEERTKGRFPMQGSPLDASVRIRVKDEHQADAVGSGTIIDSRVGKTIILTCGHIFRNRDKNAVIEVDCFCGGRQHTVVGGRKLFHDMESDVGLITINADSLASCRVAGSGTRVVKGAPVVSVGCSDGDKPTVERVKITALNRYKGADNIEVAGMPVEGRSGGGLFTQEGELIGVCSGADPHYREGFFAGLQSIHDLLDRCQLTHLYDSGSSGESQKAPANTVLASADPDETFEGEDATLGVAEPRKPAARRPAAKVAGKTRQASLVEDAANSGNDRAIREALEQAGESEIVCIIRPINQPGAATRVVIMNRASRRFVEYLSDEMDDRADILETTLTSDEEKPPRRKPVAKQPVTTQKVKRPATEPQAYRRKANRPDEQ